MTVCDRGDHGAEQRSIGCLNETPIQRCLFDPYRFPLMRLCYEPLLPLIYLQLTTSRPSELDELRKSVPRLPRATRLDPGSGLTTPPVQRSAPPASNQLSRHFHGSGHGVKRVEDRIACQAFSSRTRDPSPIQLLSSSLARRSEAGCRSPPRLDSARLQPGTPGKGPTHGLWIVCIDGRPHQWARKKARRAG